MSKRKYSRTFEFITNRKKMFLLVVKTDVSKKETISHVEQKYNLKVLSLVQLLNSECCERDYNMIIQKKNNVYK